jgi:hypothetical protein
VIARLKVQSGEILGTVKTVQQIVYPWQRIFVFNGLAIEPSVVNAHPKGSVFLDHEKDWGPIGATARLNVTHCNTFFDLLLHFGFLSGTGAVARYIDWLSTWFQWNSFGDRALESYPPRELGNKDLRVF